MWVHGPLTAGHKLNLEVGWILYEVLKFHMFSTSKSYYSAYYENLCTNQDSCVLGFNYLTANDFTFTSFFCINWKTINKGQIILHTNQKICPNLFYLNISFKFW